MDAINELGTDINSQWIFKDGDIALVSNEDNLIQATNNRLNTNLGLMEDFYIEYGCLLSKYLGWLKTEPTLKFMKIELEDTLKQDPRFTDFDVNLEYVKKGVRIMIKVIFNENTELEMDYVLNDSGITVVEY